MVKYTRTAWMINLRDDSLVRLIASLQSLKGLIPKNNSDFKTLKLIIFVWMTIQSLIEASLGALIYCGLCYEDLSIVFSGARRLISCPTSKWQNLDTSWIVIIQMFFLLNFWSPIIFCFLDARLLGLNDWSRIFGLASIYSFSPRKRS